MLLAWKENGSDIITSAWTAWGNNKSVDVAYVWGADGISWFNSATGTSRVSFKMSIDDFYRCRRNGMIDLR